MSKFLDAIKAAYLKVDSIVQCAVLYGAGTFLDNLSSMHFTKGMVESNPFSRHADGSFWLQHALVTEGFNTLEALFVSAGCYVGASIVGEKWAKFAAGVPWLYFGYQHLDAAFTNILYEIPHLYVETYADFLRRLLGQ